MLAAARRDAHDNWIFIQYQADTAGVEKDPAEIHPPFALLSGEVCLYLKRQRTSPEDSRSFNLSYSTFEAPIERGYSSAQKSD